MTVTLGLADTSLFIATEAGRELNTHLFPQRLAVSVVTVGELRAGVLAATDLATRDRRLGTLAGVLMMEPYVIDGAVADAWARLRIDLRDAGMKMPVNDSWIAATAMSLEIPVVTQDDDYTGIPGLDVIRV